MDKMLVLLSDSFANFLEDVWEDTRNIIIEELLTIDRDIKNYNNLPDDSKLKFQLKDKIDSKLTDYARQLTIRLGTFEVSFLPKDKEPVYVSEGVWSKTNRQSGRPIRIIQKLIKRKFTNYQYEQLNNLLKARIVDDGELVIVEGEDIRKYYNCENNNPGGTLENSCMRYDECQKYLDIYVDHAKMLVLLNRVTDKISGRAIVWQIGDKTFMDRVYYTKDHMLDVFINYAKEHKWYYREYNSLLDTGDSQSWYGPNDDYQNPNTWNLKIHVGYYDYFPYIDSFRYFLDRDLYDYPIDGYESCDCTDGSTSDSSYCYCCEECGAEYWGREDELPDEIYWSDHDECYYCTDCCTWNDYVDDYVLKSDLRDVYMSNDSEREIPIWELKYSDRFVEIDGSWYNVNCECIDYTEEKGWYIKDE